MNKGFIYRITLTIVLGLRKLAALGFDFAPELTLLRTLSRG